MLPIVIAGLFSALSLSAQSASASTPTFEVATEAARCEAIALSTVCLKYTAPFAETPGLFEPGVAQVRIGGPSVPVLIQVSALSPVGRQWLGLRRVGETAASASISATLPVDLEIFVDEAQLAGVKAGRFVAIVTVTTFGASTPAKLPVQLTVGAAEADPLIPEPELIPDFNVTASTNTQPARTTINVRRNTNDPPMHVSVTPETSDGGNWLTADLRFGASQCADQPLPCSFDAVVRPPQRAGEYWGVLVITGDDLADRVPVRVKVTPAAVVEPVTIEPRQITLSAPVGSNYAVSTTVSMKGGTDGVMFRAAASDPWLSVEPSIGRWPATLRVVMSPLGLATGVYTDYVTIRSIDTSEVLATIPVRFNILAPAYAPAMLDGGGWRTKLFLVNPSPLEARATLRFWSNGSGSETASPWLLGVETRGLVTRVENEIVPPFGLRVIETQGAQSRTQQGWAELVADGPVTMHAVLAEAKTVSRWLPVEATVPLMNPYRDSLLLPFDNTGGASASISLANSDSEPVTVQVSILNENGAEIAKEGKFALAPREGRTYVLADKWMSSVDRRGLVSLSYEGGRLFAVGLRSFGKGFYSYPAVACSEMGLERALPNVNAGGPWESTAYLANSTSNGQFGLLRLWPDGTRFSGQSLNSESAPLVPGNGMLVWHAPCKDTSRASGGWLESRYSKQVDGFMLLRQSYSGTPAGATTERYESAMAGQRSLSGRLAIPYDNRGGNVTRIVVVNPSNHPTDVQTVIYDLVGRYPRYSDSFRIPAKGQFVVNSADRWELGTPQGILEFSSRQGLPLTGVGLRFGDGALTILPAYEK